MDIKQVSQVCSDYLNGWNQVEVGARSFAPGHRMESAWEVSKGVVKLISYVVFAGLTYAAAAGLKSYLEGRVKRLELSKNKEVGIEDTYSKSHNTTARTVNDVASNKFAESMIKSTFIFGGVKGAISQEQVVLLKDLYSKLDALQTMPAKAGLQQAMTKRRDGVLDDFYVPVLRLRLSDDKLKNMTKEELLGIADHAIEYHRRVFLYLEYHEKDGGIFDDAVPEEEAVKMIDDFANAFNQVRTVALNIKMAGFEVGDQEFSLANKFTDVLGSSGSKELEKSRLAWDKKVPTPGSQDLQSLVQKREDRQKDYLQELKEAGEDLVPLDPKEVLVDESRLTLNQEYILKRLQGLDKEIDQIGNSYPNLKYLLDTKYSRKKEKTMELISLEFNIGPFNEGVHEYAPSFVVNVFRYLLFERKRFESVYNEVDGDAAKSILHLLVGLDQLIKAADERLMGEEEMIPQDPTITDEKIALYLGLADKVGVLQSEMQKNTLGKLDDYYKFPVETIFTEEELERLGNGDFTKIRQSQFLKTANETLKSLEVFYNNLTALHSGGAIDDDTYEGICNTTRDVEDAANRMKMLGAVIGGDEISLDEEFAKYADAGLGSDALEKMRQDWEGHIKAPVFEAQNYNTWVIENQIYLEQRISDLEDAIDEVRDTDKILEEGFKAIYADKQGAMDIRKSLSQVPFYGAPLDPDENDGIDPDDNGPDGMGYDTRLFAGYTYQYLLAMKKGIDSLYMETAKQQPVGGKTLNKNLVTVLNLLVGVDQLIKAADERLMGMTDS